MVSAWDIQSTYETLQSHLGNSRPHLPRHDRFLLHPILATESLQPLPLHPHRWLHPCVTRGKFDHLKARRFNIIQVATQTYLHKPPMPPYIFTCVALYAFDHLCRLIKSRLAIARIRPLPELDLTRVEIPTINAGWRAGQHVRLRVVSAKMGWTIRMCRPNSR